jgi:hypothetical protein
VFYPLMIGALHATSIVVSLRDLKAFRLIVALSFVVLAAIWSAATIILTLWSSPLLNPIVEGLHGSDYAPFVLYVVGSIVGASGYWLLVRLFWLRSLRPGDLVRTIALCVGGTLLSVGALVVLQTRVEISETLMTVGWWFAFSISLYWSEMSR